MTDRMLSNRTVSSSGVMLRTVPIASAAGPTSCFSILPNAPNRTFIAERFMALHISSESRKPEVPSSEPVIIDRKSTRLNSSHSQISYAVFCLKKKHAELRPSLPGLRYSCPARCEFRIACQRSQQPLRLSDRFHYPAVLKQVQHALTQLLWCT